MEPFAFEALIEALNGRYDTHVVVPALRSFANACGFELFTYLDFAGQDNQWLSNYPNEWQAHYQTKKYSVLDPVINVARNQSRPFSWDRSSLSAQLSKPQKDFFGEAEEFGIRSGITIPVFAGFGRTAMLTLATAHNAKDLPLLRDPDRATAAATYLHIYLQLIVSGALTSKTYKLTSRQINCLKWAANNKTHREIGEILNIGESAVRKHLDKAKEVLGASGVKNAIYVATKNYLI